MIPMLTEAQREAVIAELEGLAAEMGRRSGRNQVTADDVRGRIEQIRGGETALGEAEATLDAMRREGQPISQQAWKPSVVEVGHRITGHDVTMYTLITGVVQAVVGPIASPDCGGYRYQVRYEASPGDWRIATVYAEWWA
jgi:hypothetical protein